MTSLTPAQFQSIQSNFAILQKNQRVSEKQLYQIVCLTGFNPQVPNGILDQLLNVSSNSNPSSQVFNSMLTNSQSSEKYFDFKESLLFIKNHAMLQQDSKDLLALTLEKNDITTFDKLITLFFAKKSADVKEKLRQHWMGWKIHNGVQDSPANLATWLLMSTS